MRSSLLGVDYWYNYCSRIFNDTDLKLTIDPTIIAFGGFNIKATNTFFVNG